MLKFTIVAIIAGKKKWVPPTIEFGNYCNYTSIVIGTNVIIDSGNYQQCKLPPLQLLNMAIIIRVITRISTTNYGNY